MYRLDRINQHYNFVLFDEEFIPLTVDIKFNFDYDFDDDYLKNKSPSKIQEEMILAHTKISYFLEIIDQSLLVDYNNPKYEMFVKNKLLYNNVITFSDDISTLPIYLASKMHKLTNKLIMVVSSEIDYIIYGQKYSSMWVDMDYTILPKLELPENYDRPEWYNRSDASTFDFKQINKNTQFSTYFKDIDIVYQSEQPVKQKKVKPHGDNIITFEKK